MTNDSYSAMIRARTEVRRALRAIIALLNHSIGGHTVDRAEASRSCLDALEVALTVEIDDYEYSRDPKGFVRKIKRRTRSNYRGMELTKKPEKRSGKPQ